jgi:sodium/hydrogen antiporter
MLPGILVLTAFIVIYALVADWLGHRSITMPIFFMVVGAFTGVYGVGWINISFTSEEVKVLVEITLALLLFADSSTLDLHQLKEDSGPPSRLLGLGLPLIILLGGLLAFALFPQEGLGFAFLIGAILAPTDAALGLPIFTNERVPVRIRRALNVESGLNDGIATPFVTLFVALTVAEAGQNLSGWLTSALLDIAIAVAVGTALGMLGGWLFSVAMRRNLTSRAIEQIGALALVLLIYYSSLALGGNGFIASFVGGLFFSYITHHKQHQALEFTESAGTSLSLFVWLIFGSILVIPLFTAFNLLALLYAVLSLTLIRVLPVALSLIGIHFRRDTQLLMGWLGPRGLASVVFTLMAYDSFIEITRPYQILFAIAGWTIFLSVLLHGFSAQPLANWYANRLKTADPAIPELVDVPDIESRQDRLTRQRYSSAQQKGPGEASH